MPRLELEAVIRGRALSPGLKSIRSGTKSLISKASFEVS